LKTLGLGGCGSMQIVLPLTNEICRAGAPCVLEALDLTAFLIDTSEKITALIETVRHATGLTRVEFLLTRERIVVSADDVSVLLHSIRDSRVKRVQLGFIVDEDLPHLIQMLTAQPRFEHLQLWPEQWSARPVRMWFQSLLQNTNLQTLLTTERSHLTVDDEACAALCTLFATHNSLQQVQREFCVCGFCFVGGAMLTDGAQFVSIADRESYRRI
jgi:hypothetical protein